MKSNYEALGNHIRLVDDRNSEQISNNVLGISIDKEFMPSVANVIGTDLSRYKLISAMRCSAALMESPSSWYRAVAAFTLSCISSMLPILFSCKKSRVLDISFRL